MILDKRKTTQALILKSSAFVHFDATVKGVALPRYLAERKQVIFQFGLDLPVPIPDLRLDENGIEGTLSFRRVSHFCRVPWEAIFAVVGEDGRGAVWPESIRQEQEESKLKLVSSNSNPISSITRRPRPNLKVVK